MRAPLPVFRLILGQGIVEEMLLASLRVMPVRTLDTGFSFRHPLLRQALDEVLAKPSRNEPAPAATVT
jgi:NAD dependent epimerase/dehydratase family enzyme